MSTPTNPPSASSRPEPSWLVAEPFVDTDLGVLLSGKEAQINLIDRLGSDGRNCLLVSKRYVPRRVTEKGTLEALGVQRASTFRHDVEYREGRQFRKSRDRRAVQQMSAHGKGLLQSRWTGHESTVLRRLWEVGLNVPYPVSYEEESLMMEYLGTPSGAAPQLAKAGLSRNELDEAFDQLIQGLRLMARAGWVHGDLSAFNVLWWQDTLWFIDFPQAMDLAANPQGLNYLHRDVVNISTWFVRRGLNIDPEAVFADLLIEVG